MSAVVTVTERIGSLVPEMIVFGGSVVVSVTRAPPVVRLAPTPLVACTVMIDCALPSARIRCGLADRRAPAAATSGSRNTTCATAPSLRLFSVAVMVAVPRSFDTR